MNKKIFVVRNVRMENELDEKILAIAKIEDRSISNTIQRLLKEATARYFENHPEIKNPDSD
ncbi:MAG: hypothetical protein IJP96_00380 [Synergistaceae bacterium]|nr:hypothetical protein [Synergistaceae bacterium]